MQRNEQRNNKQQHKQRCKATAIDRKAQTHYFLSKKNAAPISRGSTQSHDDRISGRKQ
jgi:hypothetical protein